MGYLVAMMVIGGQSPQNELFKMFLNVMFCSFRIVTVDYSFTNMNHAFQG